jgi:hypothetical protein
MSPPTGQRTIIDDTHGTIAADAADPERVLAL